MLQGFRSGWIRSFTDWCALPKTTKVIYNLPITIYLLFCIEVFVLHNFDFYYYLYPYLNILDTVLLFIMFLHITVKGFLKYDDYNLLCVATIVLILLVQFFYNYSENYIFIYKATLTACFLILLLAKFTKI